MLGWFDRCGRHDLPWQRNRTPYAVWLSEIMLQQTQVATVIPYFERFVARFPGVGALAAADLDHVLALWSGLGYYARARNLHRAAGIVMERHAGEVPQAIEELVALPGIGRSTAGAILAQAHGLRHPILDGNVKRVLARHLALEGWPGERDVERQLWECAERHTPVDRVADYTQAVMDLGATLCVRSRPACTVCPVAEDCRACRLGIQARLPAARPKRVRPRRSIAVLVIQDPQRSVLLERRPQRGVWGGLFSFPELGDGDDAQAWCLRRLGVAAAHEQPLAPIEHAFTHFDLSLEPLLLRLDTDCAAVMDAENLLWYKPAAPSSVGIAAPINALLESLERPDADQEGANRKTMSRTVHCVVLGAESEGLDRPPYPGELGRRIYDNVSKLAWQRWLGHQTMLINEYRLSPIEPKARQFLEREMEKFFFGEGSEKPPEFQET